MKSPEQKYKTSEVWYQDPENSDMWHGKHGVIVNTAALTAAGMLEPGYTDPPGGRVVRDASGHPTGLVEETAQTQVQDLIRPYSVETIVHALDLATAHYAKEGITSFGEAGIAAGWIGHSPLEVYAYQQARRAGLSWTDQGPTPVEVVGSIPSGRSARNEPSSSP